MTIDEANIYWKDKTDKIKEMTDRELLEAEHDTEVDVMDDISLNYRLSDYYQALQNEVKKRKLESLPRLNQFLIK